MRRYYAIRIAATCLLLLSSLLTGAQTFCPTNINFENGNLSNWSFDTATNNGASGITTLTPVAAIPSRHALTSGSTTDYYGGFPIVDPVGGSYSLKLGNDSIGAQVDVAHYTVHVPATVNNYSLIYRYAVVFENPSHTATNQPFFRVRVTDSATGNVINCASFTYVAQSGLPGFSTSAYSGVLGHAVVYYKSWSTASLNLTGQAGKTLILEFMAADCSQKGHMGYGYVDLSCGLFAITAYSCNPTTSLTAPPGFQTYKWYNANYTTQVGTGQTISVTTPTTLTTYHVVLTPYTGYGCPDTLHTQVIGSTLAVNAGPDTMLCNNASVTLSPTVTGNAAPYSYNWSPAAGLSCTSCLSPVATPTTNASYIFTATDTLGCVRRDTINVKAKVGLTTTSTNPLCFGFATGTASAVAAQGIGPYTYAWNTVPAQNVANATGLAMGTYTVTATDSKGCMATKTVSITQPARLVAAISSTDSAKCFGSADGKATTTATGGTGSYSYSWNTTPVQTNATATALSTGTRIVTVTDGAGCTDTESVFIAQPQPLSLSVTKTAALCKGGTTGTAVATGAGGTPAYTYAMNGGAFGSTGSFTGLTAGVDTIHLKDSHGCTKDTAISITEPTRITLSYTLTQPLCYGSANGSISLAASGGVPGYQYAVGAGSFGNTALFSGLSAGTYALHIRDSNLCPLDSTITLGQPSALSIGVTPTNVACNGGSNGSVAVTGGGGTTAYTYAIDAGAFGTVAILGSLMVGSHTVHLKDANGCTKDSTLSIAQPVAVGLTYSVVQPLCNGASNGSVTIVGTGGIAPYSYAVNTGTFAASGMVNSLAAGTYTLHVKDANGCTKDSTMTLAQPTLLSASATKTNVSCYGTATGSIQVSASGGTAPYAYSWSGLGSTTASVTGLAAGTYTATVTDAHGCTATATQSITQPPALAASMSSTAPVCNGTPTGSATVAGSGGTAPYTYSWSTSPAQSGATINNLSSGTYSATITDAAGCTGTFSVAVPVTPRVTVSVVPTSVTCFGGSDGGATASATGSTAPYTYTWSTTPTQTGTSISGLTAGTYQVVATSAKGCMDSVLFSVSQAQKVVGTATPRATCPGFSQGTLSGSAVGGNGSYTYQWLTTPVQTGSTATGLGTGTYTLIITDIKGCKDTTSATITEFQNPVVEVAGDTVLCTGSGLQLTASGAKTYAWSPTGTLSCAACPEPVASPDANTTYTVVGTDANGCKDTAAIAIKVIQHVPLRIDAQRTICAGDSVRLGASGGISLEWIPAGLVDSNRSKTPVVRPAVTTTYYAVIRENECFTDTLSEVIEVLPMPEVNLGPDIEALIGAVVTLHAEVKNATSISWIPAEGLSCNDCFDPQHTVRGKATYVAKVSNILGCEATDTLHIRDMCDEHYFYFANTFSPNGDGQNDRFYPQGIGSTSVAHFMVYDRWGEIVFSVSNISVNDESAGWDGTFKSQPLKPDVYVYVMDAACENGKKIVVRGDVTLIR